MAVEKFIAVNNIAKVAESDVITANTELDPITANAYMESREAAEHVDEVVSELEEKANEVITESPEAPEVKEKNMYTKLTLDESVTDYKSLWNAASDDDDEDEYLDYDMYNFIYGIVTDSWPKPKNPLDHPIRKFQYTGEDDYLKTNENKGVPQVSTDVDGNIVVYADTADAFDDVRAVCKHYHINCKPVRPRGSKSSRWAFSMTIEVPLSSDGYPMMAEDFFAQYDLELADVIEDHKVGGGKSANWGKTYQKRVNKDRTELDTIRNNTEVEKIYKKVFNKAAWSNDPLDKFIKEMFAELDAAGLKYSKQTLKKRFLKEFEDDFEDEMEEGFISNTVSSVGDTIGGIVKSIL